MRDQAEPHPSTHRSGQVLLPLFAVLANRTCGLLPHQSSQKPVATEHSGSVQFFFFFFDRNRAERTVSKPLSQAQDFPGAWTMLAKSWERGRHMFLHSDQGSWLSGKPVSSLPTNPGFSSSPSQPTQDKFRIPYSPLPPTEHPSKSRGVSELL